MSNAVHKVEIEFRVSAWGPVKNPKNIAVFHGQVQEKRAKMALLYANVKNAIYWRCGHIKKTILIHSCNIYVLFM